LRNEVPAYGVALDTAADAISRSNAVVLGASIFNPSTTREMVRDGLKGASKAERDAAKAGLRSAIDERLANVNAVASDSNIEIREFQKMANELRSRAMRENM
jgi:ABC-type amino acid transport system permease subunit